MPVSRSQVEPSSFALDIPELLEHGTCFLNKGVLTLVNHETALFYGMGHSATIAQSSIAKEVGVADLQVSCHL